MHPNSALARPTHPWIADSKRHFTPFNWVRILQITLVARKQHALRAIRPPQNTPDDRRRESSGAKTLYIVGVKWCAPRASPDGMSNACDTPDHIMSMILANADEMRFGICIYTMFRNDGSSVCGVRHLLHCKFKYRLP